MRENVCHINNCVRVHESEGERVCACVSNAVLCVCVCVFPPTVRWCPGVALP